MDVIQAPKLESPVLAKLREPEARDVVARRTRHREIGENFAHHRRELEAVAGSLGHALRERTSSVSALPLVATGQRTSPEVRSVPFTEEQLFAAAQASREIGELPSSLWRSQQS